MDLLDHVRLMARYNTWMNAKVYDAAATLDPAELAADRGAFFKSVIGTLNHLAVADVTWLKRFATLPQSRPALDPLEAIDRPASLDQILESDLGRLRALRERLDGTIEAFATGLAPADLDVDLDYASMAGTRHRRRLGGLLSHLFNHQTHHRGQITTLLTQAGVDVGATDVVILVPDLGVPA
jgi:uncharacterized damage-inducible protein DinB